VRSCGSMICDRSCEKQQYGFTDNSRVGRDRDDWRPDGLFMPGRKRNAIGFTNLPQAVSSLRPTTPVLETAMSSSTRKPLTVAILLESDGPGGAEGVVFQMAEGLRELGHHVYPFGPADGAGWLSGKLRAAGFEPQTFAVRRTFDFSCLWQLWQAFGRLGIDVVHSHEFTMAIYGAGAARLRGLPHVITMHGGRYFATHPRRSFALRAAGRGSRAMTAVSEATARDLEDSLSLGRGTVLVVPNGIRFPEGDRAVGRNKLGVAADVPLLVAVGNLYPVKGHSVLLEALVGLPKEMRWRLAIAGRGAERESLERYAIEQGIHERVMFLGIRDDIPDLLAASDVFVMPSLSVGMPLALIEAMMARKPIIASEVGGIPEMVSRDVSALLCPPGDPSALMAQLHALLTDPALREQLGSAAAQRAAEVYSREVMTRNYEALYLR
jgi:glycosyltransferase involved in cell wall biosynthesis